MKVQGRVTIFAFFLSMLAFQNTSASPPACDRNDVSMYNNFDAVVEAVVTQSRRWSEGTTVHLVATYKVVDVFKGNVRKGTTLTATDRCIDESPPQHILGYPRVEDYCRGGIGLRLTGVDAKDGTPVTTSGERPNVLLFLKKNVQTGSRKATWLEVSRTGFYGGCTQVLTDIPPGERERFEQMQQKFQRTGGR